MNLKATRVVFYSQCDEAAFFEWLRKLGCEYRGVGDAIEIVISDTNVSDDVLRELLGLFHRYGIDMKQLAQFRDDDRRPWFASPGAFWFDKVF